MFRRCAGLDGGGVDIAKAAAPFAPQGREPPDSKVGNCECGRV